MNVGRIFVSTAEKIIRILYATVAFAIALALHMCSGATAYAAQSNVLRPYNEETQLYNRLDREDARMDGADKRSSAMEDELSHIEGIGEGGMVVLGILQAIGLVTKIKRKGDA